MDAQDRERLDADRGYREVGARELALREWAALGSARERRAFEALCERLRSRNYVRRIYAEGGERLERRRAINRQWAREHKARMLAAQKRSRHRRYKARPVILRCAACGAQWCAVPWARGLAHRARHCSDRCRDRARFGHRPRWAASLIARTALDLVRVGPVTVQQVRAATGARTDAVAAALRRMAARGQLVRVRTGVYVAGPCA